LITFRRATERGHANHGWLDSHHTFSFANYYDPRHMGFGALRVINDDIVAPGRGFGAHDHRDMEIISYVLEGALAHRDSMGNGSVIRPGDVQRMSAGPGVTHSEYNASETEPVHFLQIWILPAQKGLPAGYEQKHFSEDERRGRLRLIASEDGADGSVRVQQNVRLYSSLLEDGTSLTHAFDPGRLGWVQVARGTARLNGIEVFAGDGASILEEKSITLEGQGEGEVLLFDLPM
jgi:redox-sensitive bicupin YhaK (pirin superfamily)